MARSIPVYLGQKHKQITAAYNEYCLYVISSKKISNWSNKKAGLIQMGSPIMSADFVKFETQEWEEYLYPYPISQYFSY